MVTESYGLQSEAASNQTLWYKNVSRQNSQLKYFKTLGTVRQESCRAQRKNGVWGVTFYWQVVSSNWKFACKCIGLSGSCAKQTCWRKLPSFRTLGDILKRAYIATAKVSAHMVDSHKGPVPGYLVLPSLQLQEEPEKPASTQLVYLNDSQDYCERDDTAGILGTEGRQCNRSSGGEDSCTMLCCGRGYDTFSVMVSRGCHCKFHWCCQIRCKVCRSREEIHRCKWPGHSRPRIGINECPAAGCKTDMLRRPPTNARRLIRGRQKKLYWINQTVVS